MSYRSHILALLVLSAMPGSASAGWVETGNPGGSELRGTFKGLGLHLSGKINGFKVTGKHGRTAVVELDSPQGLGAPLDLPEGEWAEITLLLDGPITVRSGGVSVRLEVETLTVPLSDPDAAQVTLDWSLPDDLDLRTVSAERLRCALEDGGLAEP